MVSRNGGSLQGPRTRAAVTRRAVFGKPRSVFGIDADRAQVLLFVGTRGELILRKRDAAPGAALCNLVLELEIWVGGAPVLAEIVQPGKVLAAAAAVWPLACVLPATV